MNVLLIGGSGFVGSALATELLARSHDVTVCSRDPDVDDDRLRTVRGDVTDRASIASAFDDVDPDVVVNLVALSPLFTPSGGESMHDAVHRTGTENVVAVAESHGVSRLVQLSALGADPDGPTAYLRAKGDAERAVRESELPAVIIRPSVVFGDGGEFVSFTRTLTTPYVTGLPGGGSTRFQPIWVGDLAPILADAVEGDAHLGSTYELGGPEVLTLADVTERVYRADGKSVRVLPVPMTVARIGLTLGGFVPGFPMGADQYRSLRLDNTVDENDVTAFGRDPDELRTLAEYLADSADDAAGGATGTGGTGASSTLSTLARASAVVAALSGGAGTLSMLGAFGPVSCSTSRSTTGDGVTTVSRECNAGIDYLFGAGGNAPVLFFWAVVLALVTLVGVGSAWTGHRHVAWAATAVGAFVTVIGVMSIGWYFLLPTLSLLTASFALTVRARRRERDDENPTPL